MAQIDGLWRYDGRRAVVTGCSSGIGAEVARQLIELGAEVIGLDLKRPALELESFHEIDLSDPASIDRAAAAIGGQVDALFNIAGVSSGIGNPLLVVTINFLGMRHFTEALLPSMPPGSAIANVSSLAAAEYRANAGVTVGLLDTATMAEGIQINCTAPGVTDTPILDQLRTAFGHEFVESFQTPLGRVAGPDEQASALVFLNSAAARYITGEVLCVDGGAVAESFFGEVSSRRKVEHGQLE